MNAIVQSTMNRNFWKERGAYGGYGDVQRARFGDTTLTDIQAGIDPTTDPLSSMYTSPASATAAPAPASSSTSGIFASLGTLLGSGLKSLTGSGNPAAAPVASSGMSSGTMIALVAVAGFGFYVLTRKKPAASGAPTP